MSIAVGDPTFIVAAKQLGLYFQDDWKVSQRLTVNLGLRWDKDFNMIGGSEVTNSRTFQELQAIAKFSPLAASLVAKPANDYNKDFSPRVGFAYDLTGHGNHVLRGGFGLYYGNIFQNIPLFMEQQANCNHLPDCLRAQRQRHRARHGNYRSDQWHIGDPLPTIPAASSQLVTWFHRSPDGSQLSHASDRRVERRLHLGTQLQVSSRSGIRSRAQPARKQDHQPGSEHSC